MDQQAKHRRLAVTFWGAFTLLFLVGTLVCLVVNLGVSGQIDWAWYPVASIGLAWGLLTPLLLSGRHRLLLTWCTLSVLIMPYLSLIEGLAGGAGWAWGIGFPAACAGMLALLAAIILFRYTHINRWLCAGLTVLAFLPVSPVTEVAIARYLDLSMPPWAVAINIVATLALSLALCFFGIRMSRRKRQEAIAG